MKKHLLPFIVLCALTAVIACQQKTEVKTAETLEIPECVVTTPPDSLHLDKFYTKYVDVNGLPLVSSWRVPDSAFVAAHRTLYAMTTMLKPEILEAMRKAASSLRKSERRLWRMFAEAEMQPREIALVTGINVRTVSSMLSHARHHIYNVLKEGGFIDG